MGNGEQVGFETRENHVSFKVFPVENDFFAFYSSLCVFNPTFQGNTFSKLRVAGGHLYTHPRLNILLLFSIPLL